ncbi:MAG TPA: serine/threonine-protein kinase, partial [Phycisphaerae bacterium]|nr:serine/threonine-protein kinase [Phycisphaerae bacterium]
RDLKPGNIIVTPAGQQGADKPSRPDEIRPRILDFGLAHLTDSDVAVTTVMSGTGHISGTLPYMSPEQTRGMPDEIDVRTDVYSLGVILFELLTDARPYDLADVSMPEAVRRICHEPPRRPRAMVPQIPRDLEAIVLKALEKEPARRYSTVDALSDDIRRFLVHEPVQAQPPSATYQIRKLVERHKMPAALLAVILLLLVGFSVSLTVQASRISRERDRAVQAARVATEVNSFLNDDLLRRADPRVALGRELSVKDALDNAAKILDGRFPDEPLVEAAVRMTIGETYRRLGRFNLAEPQLRRAADLRQKQLGADSPGTLDALRELAVNYDDWKRYDEAIALFEKVLERRRRVSGERSAETIRAMDDLGVAYSRSDRPVQGEALERAALEARTALLGPDHRETILAMNNLAYVYLRLGRYSEGEPLARKAHAAACRVLGEDEPSISLHTANTLAVILEKEKQFEESERLHLRTLAARRKILGDSNADTLSSLANLGRLYVAQNRFSDAEPLLLERAKALANDPAADPEQKKAAVTALLELYKAWGRPAPASLTDAIAMPKK